ncbi:hypothetical protein LSAT2_017515, partial [Lamellibrachia satsuma]
VIWRLKQAEVHRGVGKCPPKHCPLFHVFVVTMATLSHLELCFLKAPVMADIPSPVSNIVTQHAMISLCPFPLMQNMR